MSEGAGAPVLAGLSLGLGLAAAPGPVQAVLLAESVRGGIRRGLVAMTGASATFGILLGLLAVGLSVAPPAGIVLRVLKIVGGALLVWLAIDGIRTRHRVDPSAAPRRGLPPVARGSLAIVLNPGAWLFLALVASPLLATATSAGGRGNALLTAAALLLGAMAGDAAVVFLGGLGVRRAGERTELWVQRLLAVVLAGLGLWFIVQGVVS